ncbi:hypothetical protein J2X65_003430 [Ancylobacter sp. 3268]|nr:hypothetical protein [Ancylobacter sp. 3268]
MSGEFKMTTRQRRVLVLMRDGDWHRLSCFDEMFAGASLEDRGLAESRIIAGLGADWADC